MNNISEHISYAEATASNYGTRHGIDNTPNDEQLKNMKHLAKNIFEPLRILMGNKPIHVTSFFRSEEINKGIGGSSTSQHCKGEAMDIVVYGRNKEMFEIIKDNFIFDQLIWEYGSDNEPAWVHVSLKRNGINRQQILQAKKINGKTKYIKL